MKKLKKMRREVRCRRAVRALLVLGIITGFAGAILMIGAVGSMELDVISFRDGTLLAIAGVAMFTGGVAVTKQLYSWKEILEEREWYAHLDLTAADVVGFMTYMKDCDSWAVCVDYRSETSWKFCLCAENGRPISTPIRADKKFSTYNWAGM